MPQATIKTYELLVRFYPHDYSEQEITEAVEAASVRLANDLNEGDGALVSVVPKEKEGA